MTKVQLPKVKKETRADLNRIKARREDKDLNTTLEYLIELDANKLDLTYEEIEALFRISNAVDDSEDLDFVKNCKSGSQKLYRLMKRMKGNE